MTLRPALQQLTNVIKSKDLEMPKPNAKPKKFDEHLIRRLACHQHICKMGDEALMWSFEVHIPVLKLMQSDPAWSDQVQYLRMLEALPPTEFDSLTCPIEAFDAMMVTRTVASEFDRAVIEPWYQHYVEPRFKAWEAS